MTKNIIPFPLRPEHELTYDQAGEVARLREPILGLIVGWDKDDDIFIYNFGKMTRKDALWLSEQLKRHVFGEPIG